MFVTGKSPVRVRLVGDAMYWRCSIQGPQCAAPGTGPTQTVEFSDSKLKARVCFKCFIHLIASGEWVEQN
jgi:hypothetical protein